MLYLLRHGQTEYNRMRMLQGKTDVPLNDTGREMAREAAKKFGDVQFDVCYTSPLCRAVETANIFLNGKNVQIIPDDRLMEMGFGEGEGTKGFNEPGHPLYTLVKQPGEYHGTPGGAETFEELFARTGEFLREVVCPLLREDKDVLVVGHGGMILGIVNQIRHMPVAKFWDTLIHNCELEQLTAEEVLTGCAKPYVIEYVK